MEKRLVVIGLDGATFDLPKPWSKAGHLPNLRRLLEEGAHGILKGTIPFTTLPAWTSLATGKGPGKHGCYDFRLPSDSLGHSRLITSRNIPGKTFYELLTEADKRVTLINLPVSYPPRITGTVITSLMTQGSQCVFPLTLIDEVPGLASYRIIAESRTPDAIRAVEKERFEIAQQLFEREWDFFFLLFSGSDHISHEMYDQMTQESPTAGGGQVFLDIDRYLGWFMDHLPSDTNLLVISDHGFRSYPAIFYVNSWLAQGGYLTLGGDVRPEGEDFLSKMEDTPRQERRPGLRRLSQALFNHPRLYRLGKRIYHRLRSFLPLDLDLVSRGIDLSQSVAYAATNECKGIYINDRQRFADGIVAPSDVSPLREEIIAKLEALVDPFARQPVFSRVWRKEELYHGPYLDRAPDVILESNVFISFLLRSAEPFEHTAVNYHNRDGIFLAWGPDVNGSTVVSAAEITDLAPTILHMMGFPIPEDMDGEVLHQMLEPGSEAAERAVRFCAGTGTELLDDEKQSQEDEQLVKDRLRALGYWA
ncbi:MAG: alkaline phosphatase family protein [Anaerolineae bacterium]